MARIDDYRESFRLASEELRNADLYRIAERAGVTVSQQDGGPMEIRLTFMDVPFLVQVADNVDILRDGQETEVPLPEKIIISHYLLHSSGKPPTGQLITFRQIPDGHFYYDAFQRRARDPFLATFGQDPGLFLSCGALAGGTPVDAGDCAMAFQVFPRMTIQLVLWKGDEEFPPEASLLFDSVIQEDLSAEDIAVVSGMLVYRLMGIARNQRSRSEKSRQ
jgi:hypothetical protein